jgi:ABC-type cobalamin/Fe3+-siderophores transport system ATPase subunit
MIRVIEIENIKGISSKRFELDIIPNKPSLLVAPNGFGKSSFATAFSKMNSRRIVLGDDDVHNEDSTLSPRLSIQFVPSAGVEVTLEATSTSNTINNEFDWFVINNPVKARGIGNQFGSATGELEIKDVVLVDRIPENVAFNYSYRTYKIKFGANSKVLPNANEILSNLKLIELLSKKYQELERANGARIQARINSIIGDINAQLGNAQQLHDWIRDNRLNDLRQIDYLSIVANLINGCDIQDNTEVNSYLYAIQIIWLYNEDSRIFKRACDFSNYKLEKQRFNSTLGSFNCTWRNIRTSETDGQLVVKFPKAIHISNGQRDILTFVSMLFRAKKCLNKANNILIIDEVFDYLDDANLISAQYYITQFIKEYKEEEQNIYPLILTHLNPVYFKNFAFSKQKVYYLIKHNIVPNASMVNLLRRRGDVTVEEDISKYLLHYHPNKINKRAEFTAIGLKPTWGEGDNFIDEMNTHLDNYLSGQPFDPLCVCAAVRVKIEQIAYEQLEEVASQERFLNTHKTREKLEAAEEMGVVSPESHYLLGLIYNEGMHWKDGMDNVSPIASKLENLTIKKLISDIFI